MTPKARTTSLVVEEIFDEVIVADMTRNKAHHLNRMAAFVWQQCDGEKTPQQIATLVSLKFQTDEAEAMVWMSLERLERAHLMEQKITKDQSVLSRREMLRLAKIAGIAAALLPVVATVTVPSAAMASSHGECGTCTPPCGAINGDFRSPVQGVFAPCVCRYINAFNICSEIQVQENTCFNAEGCCRC